MYNFDKLYDRKETYSYKWDVDDGVLPLWVADMDFEVFPGIVDAIKKRLEIPVFGYTNTPKEYFLAFKNFFNRRHNFDIDLDSMIFSTGVVPQISSIVRKITSEGDNVLVLTPTYNIFYNSIINNNRIILRSELLYDGKSFNIDFNDLEEKLKLDKTTLMILSNPINPVGKILTYDELKKIGELAYKYNVIVLSDEIHCDIVTPGYKYVPFQSVNDINKYNSIMSISASKCFNLAGLQGSLCVIFNKDLKKRVERGLNTDEVAEGNCIVYDAFISALNDGDRWLDEMNQYVYNNKLLLKEYIDKNIPELIYNVENSLYLAWVNCKNICSDTRDLCEYLEKNYKVKFSDGFEYGINSKEFIRINLATSKSNVIDALNRLYKGIKAYKKDKNGN